MSRKEFEKRMIAFVFKIFGRLVLGCFLVWLGWRQVFIVGATSTEPVAEAVFVFGAISIFFMNQWSFGMLDKVDISKRFANRGGHPGDRIR